MFKNPFSFKGRIGRMEYGLSQIIYWSVIVTILLLFGLGKIGAVFTVFYLPALWFLLAQGVKRCHDRNNSGWFILIPFYGLFMLFADGDAGSNKYGPDPKGRVALNTSFA